MRVAFTWKGAASAAAVVSFPLTASRYLDRVSGRRSSVGKSRPSLGASRLDAFFSVALPLACAGVLAGAVLGFGRASVNSATTILVAGSIVGQTQTIRWPSIPGSIGLNGIRHAWPLVAVSVALACVALAGSEYSRAELGLPVNILTFHCRHRYASGVQLDLAFETSSRV